MGPKLAGSRFHFVLLIYTPFVSLFVLVTASLKDGINNIYHTFIVALFRSLGMVCSMAFDRKWVSDTNLDKLWSDTLEKKEANKQRRSPDFCKEAILSATLKRISSEMLMRRLSSPMIDIDLNSDDEDDTLAVIASVSGVMDCDEHISFLKSLPDEKPVEKPCSKLTLTQNVVSTKENTLSELCTAIEMAEIEPVPKSPKRKWSDTDDTDIAPDEASVQCSPAKRSRPREKLKSKLLSPKHHKRSQSPVPKDNSTKCEKSKKRLFTLPKVKIIPADDDSDSAQKTELNMALLTPVRSVANSISELSIEVDDGLKSNSGAPWCLTVTEPIHNDPLELDGFFNNLKKVTS